jgi:hypothetical protein
MVFFGPIARHEPNTERARLPEWRLISIQNQWDRSIEEVPRNASPVLLRRHFDDWGERYLNGDPLSRIRSPAAVEVPCGAFQDIFGAWGRSAGA